MLLACRPTTPPATVGPGTLETLLIEHDDLIRSAQVYTPEGFDSSFALPVVLNFHGFGGMAQDHMTYTDMASTADEQSFLLVGFLRDPFLTDFLIGTMRCPALTIRVMPMI